MISLRLFCVFLFSIFYSLLAGRRRFSFCFWCLFAPFCGQKSAFISVHLRSKPFGCGFPLCASVPLWLFSSLVWLASLTMSLASSNSPALLKSEFIFESAPFPQCHASTIAETKNGLVAAWFGGTHERHPDVGIWLSRNTNGSWTVPVEVANGIQSPTNRFPCWNPVLFERPNGPLLLFYKVGPSPSTWWGMLM